MKTDNRGGRGHGGFLLADALLTSLAVVTVFLGLFSCEQEMHILLQREQLRRDGQRYLRRRMLGLGDAEDPFVTDVTETAVPGFPGLVQREYTIRDGKGAVLGNAVVYGKK